MKKYINTYVYKFWLSHVSHGWVTLTLRIAHYCACVPCVVSRGAVILAVKWYWIRIGAMLIAHVWYLVTGQHGKRSFVLWKDIGALCSKYCQWFWMVYSTVPERLDLNMGWFLKKLTRTWPTPEPVSLRDLHVYNGGLYISLDQV